MARLRIVYGKDGERIAEYRDGELVFSKERQANDAGFFIMGDIQPYRSMIDGSLITSRSRHREHLKEHGCIEIGNDSSLHNARPHQYQSPPGLKEAISEAIERVKHGYSN